jgi:hypothetical protein
MPAGTTLRLGSWTHGDYVFEVWQRKNESRMEPFATALFVRQKTDHWWEAFSLGHQDCYAPAIRLQPDGPRVGVFRSGRELGVFDTKVGGYVRAGGKEPIREGTTDSPGNWWVSP